MINRSQLLKELQRLLGRIEADLLERSNLDTLPEVRQSLRSEYEQAKQSERTAQSYEQWRSDYAMHIGAAWILSCVFVRFLEDNALIDPPMISGQTLIPNPSPQGEGSKTLTPNPSPQGEGSRSQILPLPLPGEREAGRVRENRLQRARDEHEQYFRSHPTETDREYLLAGFGKLAKLSGGAEVFGQHNPVYEVPTWLSGDAAGELLKFFQQIDPGTGTLVHDFTDANWDTRFLGDLYQDLSERARKKYALLQTPHFVEQFILDRTLEPAIEEFGLQGFRMIDPACGSGHFLLGSFQRLIDRWYRQDPNEKYTVLAQRALDSVYGVDINPFAVAIARFRLLLAAMKEAGITGLRNAPDFKIHLACGDSLLHGEGTQLQLAGVEPLKKHHYRSEDVEELNQILIRGHYHAVVANPPYIVPKDAAANAAYRKLYLSCNGKYSLVAPFIEKVFDLAVPKGFTGQITANSFMKREFGKKLIKEIIAKVDLTHVIDTSGAYIPGHGTPTVILLGRNRKFIGDTIRTVMGIKGEPSTPDNPAQGKVWSAILKQVDLPGSQSEFVSVADSVRDAFHHHPWSIGGGGATELKDWLDGCSSLRLKDVIDDIGMFGVTGADEVMVSSTQNFQRHQIEPHVSHLITVGDEVRDWLISEGEAVLLPYIGEELLSLEDIPKTHRWLWSYRIILGNRTTFTCRTYFVEGHPWWEWRHVTFHRIRNLQSIVYAEVATHNHFVSHHGSRVFKQSAPLIKLAAQASQEDYFSLLGFLNSSTACFWLKQVCYPKGTATGDISTEKGRAEANRYAFNSSAMLHIPIPTWSKISKNRVISLVKELDLRARRIQFLNSLNRTKEILGQSLKNLDNALNLDKNEIELIKGKMIFLQEELDWTIYEAFKLVEEKKNYNYLVEPFPNIKPNDRPCKWSMEPIDLPNQLLEIYKKRRQEIHQNGFIQLIETSVYKRPWYGKQGVYGLGSRTTEELQKDAIGKWLLDRLETYFDFDGRMNDNSTPTAKVSIDIPSTAKLADLAQQDPDFMQVGALYRHSDTFHLQTLIDELIEAESVPLLPILRYKPTGLRKRTEWEHTWTLQRQEDAIDARTQLPTDHPDHLSLLQAKDLKTREIGTIPVPPKYTSADFLKSHYWRLRGKLDVPKERWVSFPHCEGNDGKLAIAWAGYDHLQLTQALSDYYINIKENLGGSEDPRLVPILACLLELLPWLKQWHSAIDPTYGYAMSDYFEDFIQEEARYLNQTLDQIRAWEPPKRTNRRR